MVKIDTIKAGDGINFPKKGDTVTMHYVGSVHVTSARATSSLRILRRQLLTPSGTHTDVVTAAPSSPPELASIPRELEEYVPHSRK